MKKLRKNKSQAVICGVCAGIADYFDLDPTLVRLALAAFTVLGGSGVLLYIVGALLMPDDDGTIDIE